MEVVCGGEKARVAGLARGWADQLFGVCCAVGEFYAGLEVAGGDGAQQEGEE